MDANDKKMNAAYALNLCTVSVSQIIDYEDLNVMEQEYEAILNNLNLENMPHDEALLNILKQLLDTITFFRLQEGDKRIVDLRYRQRMTNAIWNAAPNLGLIVAGGNPFTMAVSLASQVGIGYMNYRRAKAENKLEYEEQQWKLQRTAIEQFNGLQRELLDTAWRLADTYGFEDKLRLTERQIKHYDSILMDENALRKYDRLDSIKESFEAYPPFWYQLGNTSNAIARDETISISEESRAYYRNKAKEHFEQFWISNKYPLLREDQIASSCALEYVDLLIEDGEDKGRIVELIDSAVKYAGRSWDVLQLCAIAYLRVGDTEKAISAFRVLTNENYNTLVNAQLLSGLYISQNDSSFEAKALYEALACKVDDKGCLIPWPENGVNIEEEFNSKQRENLLRQYVQMLNSFKKKYSVLINMLIPIPSHEMQRVGADYSDARFTERINALENTLVSSMKVEYLNELNENIYGIQLVNLLNKMLHSLSSLSLLTDMEAPVQLIEKKISDASVVLEKIQGQIRSYKFSIDDYKKLNKVVNGGLLDEIFDCLAGQIENSIEEMKSMLQFSSAASEMVEFCQNEEIAVPGSIEEITEEIVVATKSPKYLKYELLGDKAVISSKVIAQKDEMQNVIKNKLEKSLKRKGNVVLMYPGTDGFNEYFSKVVRAVKRHKTDVIAVLDDKSLIFDTDLLFTTNAILVVEHNNIKKICLYDSVYLNKKDNELNIGGISYSHSHVDIKKMYAALVELKQLSQKR